MSQRGHLTVFEYDSVMAKAPGVTGNLLPVSVFTWLRDLCLDACPTVEGEERATHFMQLRSVKGRETIRFTHYVGVLQSPCGFQIEILPKTGRVGTDPAQSRALVLKMLASLEDMPELEFGSADLACFDTLLEWLMGRFLQACNQVVKHGLRSAYVEREENQAFLKGKLLAAQQLRHNLVQRQRNYVQLDELLTDRPENRLLRSALDKIAGHSQDDVNLKLCRELRFALDDVPPSRCIERDFNAIHLERGMGYYREAIRWSQFVLEGVTPFSQLGHEQGISILFPMHQLFESFVAQRLSRQIPKHLSLKTQGSSASLVTYKTNNWFNLIPDLQLFEQQRRVAILDTKWKLLDAAKGNRKDKFNLSQADFYQLFAYGHKLLNGEGELFLIYPKTAHFMEPIADPFCFSEGLKLWVVPFDLELDRVIWPKDISLNMGEA